MSTHGYTDAHFAAMLLHCGPHTWHDCDVPDPGECCAINRRYKSAVYSHFFDLFPEMVGATDPNARGYLVHEWTSFWREYIEWVET